MAPPAAERGPRTLVGRLLLWPSIATLAVLLTLALVITAQPGRTSRVVLGLGFGLAALAVVVVLAATSGSLARRLRRLADSVERMGRGEFDAEAPGDGPDELAALAGTVNRTREEVGSQIEALRREQALRDSVLSSLQEGVALFGRSDDISYRSARVDRLLNRSVEHVRDLWPPTLRDLVDEARTEGTTRVAEVETGMGRRTLQATATPLPDGHVLLVLRDVTTARLAETIRRDFVANASHELKTPVASIRALAETIADSAATDPRSMERFVAQLEGEAVRLSRIVSDLLDLSRLEGEAGPGVRVELDRVVAEEFERHRERAREANLELRSTIEEVPPVVGSPWDLTLLVRNLVENAIQHTRPGGSVEVSLSADDATALLKVRDTGIGIPRRDQSRIFERFYRVDRARSRETGGTGLGLSIVKHVAENHGGTVEVESELGRGSTFLVRLPLARGA